MLSTRIRLRLRAAHGRAAGNRTQSICSQSRRTTGILQPEILDKVYHFQPTCTTGRGVPSSKLILWYNMIMRYRDYKTFTAGNYYHVFNRGNGKNDIFFDPQDYGIFIHRLRENLFPENELEVSPSSLDIKYKRKQLPTDAFSLICYCLMPNHFHLLIRQNNEIKISKLIQKLCTGYAVYFQKKYDHVGHLFQGAFKAIPVENESYLTWLSAYIHQNPTVAGIVKTPDEYAFSSYSDYIEKRNDGLCDKRVIMDKFKTVNDYKKFVEESGPLIEKQKQIQALLID